MLEKSCYWIWTCFIYACTSSSIQVGLAAVAAGAVDQSKIRLMML